MEKRLKAAQLCRAKKPDDAARNGLRSCGQKIRPICSAASSTRSVATRQKSSSRRRFASHHRNERVQPQAPPRNYFKLIIVSVSGKHPARTKIRQSAHSMIGKSAGAVFRQDKRDDGSISSQ